MTRIGILVVAYNAATTLVSVLDRIPESFRPRITEVLVGDDHSQDDTFSIGLDYQQRTTDLPITVVRHPRNLGYGGNQKAGYRWAIEQGLDIVVLLHGDGQYAPEMLPEMVAPLERGEADAVFGSRLLEPGAARKGGMPLYKFVGNRILTTVENAVVGLGLSEWHSGYRAYSVDALRSIPFEQNSDRFDFDSQVIIQLHDAGRHIVEIPIPTFYGDEICRVNGMGYARDITLEAVHHRLHKQGRVGARTALATDADRRPAAEGTPPARLLRWLTGRPPARVLDLGCGDGTRGGALRAAGHEVTGVDVDKIDPVTDRVDRFIAADLDAGIPAEAGAGFDLVVAAGVLDRHRRPDALLRAMRSVLAPGGTIVVTVPTVAPWYPGAWAGRRRFAPDAPARSGDRRFTTVAFEAGAARAGLVVVRREATMPDPGDHRRAAPGSGVLTRADHTVVGRWPGIFDRHVLYELAAS